MTTCQNPRPCKRTDLRANADALCAHCAAAQATGLPLLTEDQLEAVWRRAGAAQDYTMCDFVERALDGNEAAARVVARSVRDVAIYAAAVKAIAS